LQDIERLAGLRAFCTGFTGAVGQGIAEIENSRCAKIQEGEIRGGPKNGGPKNGEQCTEGN
jgi:hypothetical protein